MHVAAAAKACELAMTRGSRGLYNVAEPSATTNSGKAIQLLGWNAAWRG